MCLCLQYPIRKRWTGATVSPPLSLLSFVTILYPSQSSLFEHFTQSRMVCVCDMHATRARM